MKNMVIHKCDRCGAETENPHTIFYQADRVDAVSKSTELCGKCYSEFIGWLNGADNGLPEYEHHWQEVTDKTERNGG